MAAEGDTVTSGSETRSEVGLVDVTGAPRVVAVAGGGGDCGGGGSWGVADAIPSELELVSISDAELSCSVISCEGGRV